MIHIINIIVYSYLLMVNHKDKHHYCHPQWLDWYDWLAILSLRTGSRCIQVGCVCVCSIWTDVKHFFSVPIRFIVHVCRGHRPIVDTCANEAIPQRGKRRLITSVYLHFRLSWQGAKPRTPTREILVLHSCRNLRFSSTSFSTLFAWYFYSHGEGLSREPYIDYFPYFGPHLIAFLVTMVISEYLPLFEWYYLGYRVSHRICTLKDSVPDGSL